MAVCRDKPIKPQVTHKLFGALDGNLDVMLDVALDMDEGCVGVASKAHGGLRRSGSKQPRIHVPHVNVGGGTPTNKKERVWGSPARWKMAWTVAVDEEMRPLGHAVSKRSAASTWKR